MSFSHDRRTNRAASSLGRNGNEGKEIEQNPLCLGTLPNGVALVGESDSIRRIGADVALAASTPITVLIQGETGTGKEIIANSLHALSQRRAKPFVVVNCAEFNESLIESELFGYTKNSFTGAHGNRKGLFDEADEGTIFFDEIGELPITQQPKLLRVLQERKIRPIGAPKPHSIDVRLIAATNRDLDAEVEAGRFRRDLLQRIKLVRIFLPPLRERGNDVKILIQHFLKKVFPIAGLNQPAQITPDAVAYLCSYSWPGNVRELENILTTLSLRSRETGAVITLEMARREFGNFTPLTSASSVDMLGWTWEEFEDFQDRQRYTFILEMLRRRGGDKAAVAAALNIGLDAFYKRLRKLSIKFYRNTR